MRILFLTSRLPYPPYRGDKLKICNLIRQLSARHEIFLLSFIQARAEQKDICHIQKLCRSVHVVYLPTWRSLLNCMLNLWGNTPFQVAYFRSEKMTRALARLLDETKPDVLHTHLIRMAQYASDHQAVPRILDMTDAVSLYLERFRKIERNPVKRWALGAELRRMMKYDSVIPKFEAGLVCSEVDRQYLKRREPGANMQLLENGVDLEQFLADCKSYETDSRRVIFTGNMAYFPNMDAALYLAKEIFPIIEKAVPGATLHLVGQRPPRSLRALASEKVQVSGFVSDIRAEYLKSAVAVSPVRFGAGTLNKVLEPLALGIPVVSTSIGFEGLELKDGEDILVADDPREFAERVIRLLTDRTLRQRLAASGQKKVRDRFGWDKIATSLEEVYRAVANHA